MSATPIPPNIEEFTAPLLLGIVWNWCLYGVLVVQCYVYSYNFPRDAWYIKLLVYSIFVLETLQTAFSGADLYYWFATGYGKVERLAMPYFSYVDVPIMGSVVSLSVQFFFVYRIWVLSKKRWWWLCAIICLFSIVGAVGAVTGGTYSHIHGKFASGKVRKTLALTWLLGNTISDLLIASAMLYHLTRLKERDSLSNHALVSILRLTVETNLVTTTVSIISLLVVVLYPDRTYFLCPAYVFGKLYSNTLFVSLNNRISIRDTFDARGGVVDCQLATLPGSARSEPTTGMIFVETEEHQKHSVRFQLEEADMDGKVANTP